MLCQWGKLGVEAVQQKQLNSQQSQYRNTTNRHDTFFAHLAWQCCNYSSHFASCCFAFYSYRLQAVCSLADHQLLWRFSCGRFNVFSSPVGSFATEISRISLSLLTIGKCSFLKNLLLPQVLYLLHHTCCLKNFGMFISRYQHSILRQTWDLPLW